MGNRGDCRTGWRASCRVWLVLRDRQVSFLKMAAAPLLRSTIFGSAFRSRWEMHQRLSQKHAQILVSAAGTRPQGPGNHEPGGGTTPTLLCPFDRTIPQCATRLACGVYGCSAGLTTDTSQSPWPQPQEPGLEGPFTAGYLAQSGCLMNIY